jgi:hypothetical protein
MHELSRLVDLSSLVDRRSRACPFYKQYFTSPFPARTTVQSNLHGFDLEVEAVGCLPTSLTP